MNSKSKKEKIYRLIKDASDEKLNYVLEAISTYEKNVIVGSTVDGKPLTKLELTRSLEKASQQIEEGKFFTTEELKKEMVLWRKK